VNAALPSLFEFEMFHGVGDVHLRPVYARLFQRAIEQPAGRADERLALAVFLITWLLPNEHDSRRP